MFHRPQHHDALRWYLCAGASVVIALLTWVSMQVYADREMRYRHQVESIVKNTNETTRHNLVKWRSLIIGAGNTLSDDPLFARALAQWLAEPESPVRQDLEARIRALTERGEFAKVFLYDTEGQLLLSTAPNTGGTLQPRERHALAQAFASAESVVIEPYQQTTFAYPTISLMAPLYDGFTAIGALWMVVDLRASLIPLLQTSQHGQATAESMLLLQDGQDILHINPLRHRASHPLDRFAGIEDHDLVAVQAFAGTRGVLYGKDYRGHQVLAASSVVPDSPWMLVTKIDVAEAFSDDQRKEGIWFGLLIGASALLVLAFLAYWMWRSQRREHALKIQLEKQMQWLERAQKTASIGAFSLDFERREIALSPVAAEILGTPDCLTLPFEALPQYLPAAQLRKNLHELMQVRRTRQARKIELDIHTESRKTRTIECWCEAENSHDKALASKIIGTLQDISQRKVLDLALEKYRSLLEYQVRKDSLTGLSNRRALDEELNREWLRSLREQRPLAVLLIDIDHFKGYNDCYGHLEGDTCLQRVARLLEQNLRRPSDQVFRYGGEEFVVLLPHTNLQQAVHVAQNLREAIAAQNIPSQAAPVHGVVTISIGVASATPQPAPHPATCPLIGLADEALYQAKALGRNQVCAHQRQPAPGLKTHS